MKVCPSLDRYGLLFGTGMISDDTEHTVMLAQALIESGGDEVHFARDFAWRLKGWLLALPAGVGVLGPLVPVVPDHWELGASEVGETTFLH